jgi:hypothetical protein
VAWLSIGPTHTKLQAQAQQYGFPLLRDETRLTKNPAWFYLLQDLVLVKSQPNQESVFLDYCAGYPRLSPAEQRKAPGLDQLRKEYPAIAALEADPEWRERLQRSPEYQQMSTLLDRECGRTRSCCLPSRANQHRCELDALSDDV